MKTKEEKIKEKKDKVVTFKKGTSFERIENMLAEIMVRLDELENPEVIKE